MKDAQAAEAWLNSQESYLKTQDLGDSVEAVEKLQKKHELFEKSLLAQTDRFNDLDRVTTVRVLDLPVFGNEFEHWPLFRWNSEN